MSVWSCYASENPCVRGWEINGGRKARKVSWLQVASKLMAFQHHSSTGKRFFDCRESSVFDYFVFPGKSCSFHDCISPHTWQKLDHNNLPLWISDIVLKRNINLPSADFYCLIRIHLIEVYHARWVSNWKLSGQMMIQGAQQRQQCSLICFSGLCFFGSFAKSKPAVFTRTTKPQIRKLLFNIPTAQKMENFRARGKNKWPNLLVTQKSASCKKNNSIKD